MGTQYVKAQWVHMLRQHDGACRGLVRVSPIRGEAALVVS